MAANIDSARLDALMYLVAEVQVELRMASVRVPIFLPAACSDEGQHFQDGEHAEDGEAQHSEETGDDEQQGGEDARDGEDVQAGQGLEEAFLAHFQQRFEAVLAESEARQVEAMRAMRRNL